MVSERREAIEVARHLLRRKRGESDAVELEALGVGADGASGRVVDWRDIVEFRVLRDPDALYEEFLLRKEAGDAKQIGALLYAAMKFPEHPEAVEMLNCCAYNRAHSAERSGHLAQALQGYNLALSLAKGEERWKVALNRLALLNVLGISRLAVREGGWLLAELPSDHPYTGMLCQNMGMAYEHMARYDLAATCYERAIWMPEYRAGYHDYYRSELIAVLARIGRIATAEHILAQVHDKSSMFHSIASAQLLLAKNDLHACVDVAKAALQRWGDRKSASYTRRAVAELHRILAEAYTALGQTDFARDHRAVSKLFNETIITGKYGGA